jgi:hypothetical protein
VATLRKTDEKRTVSFQITGALPLKELPGQLHSPWFRPTEVALTIAGGQVIELELSGPRRLPAGYGRPARDAREAGSRRFGLVELSGPKLPEIVRQAVAAVEHANGRAS